MTDLSGRAAITEHNLPMTPKRRPNKLWQTCPGRAAITKHNLPMTPRGRAHKLWQTCPGRDAITEHNLPITPSEEQTNYDRLVPEEPQSQNITYQ